MTENSERTTRLVDVTVAQQQQKRQVANPCRQQGAETRTRFTAASMLSRGIPDSRARDNASDRRMFDTGSGPDSVCESVSELLSYKINANKESHKNRNNGGTWVERKRTFDRSRDFTRHFIVHVAFLAILKLFAVFDGFPLAVSCHQESAVE